MRARFAYCGMIISDQDLSFCRWVAEQRNASHSDATNERISTRDSDVVIHLEGVLAEMAWRRALGISDAEPWLFEGRDPGWDFQWAGLTVDCKASKRYAKMMMIPEYKTLTAQVYVMATVEALDRVGYRSAYMVRPIGGISRARFMRIHQIGREFPPFRVSTRWVWLEDLCPIEGLQSVPTASEDVDCRG